ncbi:hypothetical protein NQ315_011804 [Exocentrus adspersus]|uniref:Uncharacterized protein n=1 Tax=Exocentrus adspersus TaxID=1586481 RepID=A0AAV8W164_9CUCU|nr:hypothetical protein NQ315_011804 [Exocentrus adspersus]
MHTKKDNTQKVIIPKGTVQSGQDTIIEIPKHLQTHPILVAARLDNVKSKGPVVPYRVEIVKPKICPHSVLTTTSTPPNKASTSSCCAMGHGNALPSSSKYSSEIELNETETKEMETIMKQLQQFQKARRQFLLDTDAIGGTRSIPTLAKDVFDVSWNNPKFNDAFIMDSPPSTSSPIRREIRDSILVERNKRYGSNDLALLSVCNGVFWKLSNASGVGTGIGAGNRPASLWILNADSFQ